MFSIKKKVPCVRDRLIYSDPHSTKSLTLPIMAYRQNDMYSCGFVAGAMVLHTYRPEQSLERFYARVSPDEDSGTGVTALIQALRKSGISVTWKSRLTFREVKRVIKRGCPVVVSMGEEEYGHWAVIYGYDESTPKKRIYLAGNKNPDGTTLFGNRIHWSVFRRKYWAPEGFGLVCSYRR
jgi:hypothetical protein